MGNIIAIAAPKGRVGKTTTAVNLAIAFALSGKKTLLVDLDPAGSCAAGLGFSKEEVANELFNDLKSDISLSKYILKTGIENLYFIQIERLPYLDERKFGEIITNELILRNILRPEASAYDYVVLDCPPHLTGTINAGLIASDGVIIPVVPGEFSIAPVRKMIAHLNNIREEYNHELKIEGILLTMYEFNNSISFSSKKELFRYYPQYTLNTSIPKNAETNKATINNNKLLISDIKNKMTKVYIKLAEELIERKNLFKSDSKV